MLQSSWMDPVLGLDIHIVEVPAPPSPKPIPTPIPMPYVGMVIDPIGFAVGAALSQAISGNPGVVLVNNLPVTNCGTEVTNRLTLPHLPVPGVAFTLGIPRGNAELYFGAYNISLMGSFGVRLGDVALSCGDPVRLPTSVVLAIPKGIPVLTLSPMVLDVKALAMMLAMRGLFSGIRRGGGALFRWIRRVQRNSDLWAGLGRRMHSAVDRIAPRRLRSALHRASCFLTGHPVDVATGRVLTDNVDAELPGPLPLTFERSYDSSLSFRDGPLGHGWSHSLDQAVWTERGKVVYRAPEGREIEFHLHDWPNHELPVGYAAYQPVDRLSIRNLGEGRWELETAEGIFHEFAPVPGRAGESPIVKKRTRDGHTIEFYYDDKGRLEWVRDCGGRLIKLEYDARGHLTSLHMPTPKDRGWYRHREYIYDEHGDLIEVKDALGASWRFDYDGHLLVQETDRTGLSFYFQYDSRGPGAYCVRTWGDGGIYDHVIDYDKLNRQTVVTNSLEHVTQYEMDRNGLVVKITDALGHETRFEYDPFSFQVTAEVDALGHETRRTYDRRGNVESVVGPDGAEIRFEYHERFNEPTLAVDPLGGEWRFSYDSLGHLMARTLPTGESIRLQWGDGLLRSITNPAGHTTGFGYDAQKNLDLLRLPNGAENHYHHDGQGRLVKVVDARGGVTQAAYDLEGRQVEATSPVGVAQSLAYDAEGNLIESRDATRHIRFRQGHFHRLVEREEAGTAVLFEYDSEDQLTAVINEAGERYLFDLDALGNVVAETGFDGFTRRYARDAAGRVTELTLPENLRTKMHYDSAGRVTEVHHFDGTSEQYEYGLDSSLL